MTDQRLFRSQRLKKPASFTAAIRKGLFLRGTLLNIWFIRQEEADRILPKLDPAGQDKGGRPALGIMVSRKVHLRAVKRNLWKRRIREAFRRNQTGLKSGWALVVQAKKQPKIPAYSEIEKELVRLCARAGLTENL